MVGLHEQWVENFEAPFVAESKIKFGLSLQQIIPIPLNNTYFVIGKIEIVFVDETYLLPDGFIDLVKAESLCSSGIDAYHTVSYLDRFAYAKPDLPVKKIDNK